MSTTTKDVPLALRQSLARFRELRGLSQAKLGKKAGFAAASISHFETGQRIPSLESIVKLADALEVSVDALIGRVPAETGTQVDPIFLRASRASAEKLDAVRRVTAALLGEDADR